MAERRRQPPRPDPPQPRIALGLAAVVASVALAAGVVFALAGATADLVVPSAVPVVGAASPATSTASPSSLPSHARSAPPTIRPAATAPPTAPAAKLPALVGAIGDSLTAAVDADGRLGVQPQHSWVVGTDPDDHVTSHLERLRALGARPEVVEPYRPGAPIGTATRQAGTVVDAAAALPRGTTAYVTFELGANDVCAPTFDATTDPDAFESAARSAFELLADGLPPGSLLLVLSVPDVVRLRELAADVPAAVALHARYRVCESVLGADVDPDAVTERIEAYNGILGRLCRDVRSRSFDCRFDLDGDRARSLFGAVFGLDDLSPLDYFHPSIAGQARIAEESWRLTPWGSEGEPVAP